MVATMPTPFTHLANAKQLLADSGLLPNQRALLEQHWGAFLLGSIAPDAHSKASGLKRSDTHFFEYTPKVDPPAEDVLFASYPELVTVNDSAHAAFIAGYLGHLAMDEVWCERVIMPIRLAEHWGSRTVRQLVIVLLVGVVDGRDYAVLPTSYHVALSETQPQDWLPFLSDEAIVAWGQLVAGQIAPDGVPFTTDILGRTIPMAQAELAALLESPVKLQSKLWDYFSQARLAEAEAAAYQHMRSVVCTYLHG